MSYPLSKKLNPLWWIQNEDDGNCGDKGFFERVCNNKCDIKCKIRWFIRNPFHNFMFYVIGVADRKCDRKPKSIWNKKGYSWNFDYTKCKWLYLPLISYRSKNGKFEFYFGWRDRGNFGIACRFH